MVVEIARGEGHWGEAAWGGDDGGNADDFDRLTRKWGEDANVELYLNSIVHMVSDNPA